MRPGRRGTVLIALPPACAPTFVAAPRGSAGAAVLARTVVAACRVGTALARRITPAVLAVATVIAPLGYTTAVTTVGAAVTACRVGTFWPRPATLALAAVIIASVDT
eukprot:COSAG01_NODE_1311_length_10774_cov_18.218299_5_plen_107_part_00